MIDEITCCPLCEFQNAEYQYVEGNFVKLIFSCPQCGKFFITTDLKDDLKDPYKYVFGKGFILAGLARELNEINKKKISQNYPYFYSKDIEKFLKHHLVPDLNDPRAKANKLLDRFIDKSDHFGYVIQYNPNKDISLAYAKNLDEFEALVELLVKSELIERIGDEINKKVTITAKGWDLANERRVDSNQGFIAIRFNKKMEESFNTIKAAIRENDYHASFLWGEHFPDRIMDKALKEIRKSKFVVADLTDERPSVFYEAGFAHALNLDVIYVYSEKLTDEKLKEIKEKSLTEFYVQHYQCHKYDTQEQLKELVSAAIGARVPKK